MSQTVPSAEREAMLRLLEHRRSVGMMALGEPGPSPEELRRLLTIATRVPDHAILEPWRLLLIEGEARREASERMAQAYVAANPAMDPSKRAKFAGIMARLFTHAPLVIVVISRPNTATAIPVFEQELSAGAVCMNLLNAVHALGYAGTWVTGFAGSAPAAAVYGLDEGERVAGILHIGTPKEAPQERPRPDLDRIVTHWSPAD
ncbi:nitroreductase [Bosea sp. 117]|uniref:nitroreductase family protein n=1 Tax=Bosea sp. 117 TaxID=1125973 RepID=UPI00049489AD|nr:nitroreductase [Bosea sp. 117]